MFICCSRYFILILKQIVLLFVNNHMAHLINFRKKIKRYVLKRNGSNLKCIYSLICVYTCMYFASSKRNMFNKTPPTPRSRSSLFAVARKPQAHSCLMASPFHYFRSLLKSYVVRKNSHGYFI